MNVYSKYQSYQSPSTMFRYWLCHFRPTNPLLRPTCTDFVSVPMPTQFPIWFRQWGALARNQRVRDTFSWLLLQRSLQTALSSRDRHCFTEVGAFHVTLSFQVLNTVLYHWLQVVTGSPRFWVPDLSFMVPSLPPFSNWSFCEEMLLFWICHLFPDGIRTDIPHKPGFITRLYTLPCFITRLGRVPLSRDIKGHVLL